MKLLPVPALEVIYNEMCYNLRFYRAMLCISWLWDCMSSVHPSEAFVCISAALLAKVALQSLPTFEKPGNTSQGPGKVVEFGGTKSGNPVIWQSYMNVFLRSALVCSLMVNKRFCDTLSKCLWLIMCRCIYCCTFWVVVFIPSRWFLLTTVGFVWVRLCLCTTRFHTLVVWLSSDTAGVQFVRWYIHRVRKKEANSFLWITLTNVDSVS